MAQSCHGIIYLTAQTLTLWNQKNQIIATILILCNDSTTVRKGEIARKNSKQINDNLANPFNLLIRDGLKQPMEIKLAPGLPVKFDDSPDASVSQYEKSREFIIRPTLPQQYTEETITIDGTNYQYINQNDDIHNWIKGCQVLGFIPDHPPSDNSPTQKYYDHLNYQNQQTYGSTSYKCYSSKPAQKTLRVNLKRRRKRTIFTTQQIVFLEGVFQRTPYITREERVAMMNRLQLSEKAIKVWFQNRRRMTKKCQEYNTSDSPSSMDTTDSFSDRLTLIETQIQENTDENGYVTLNDQVMSELVSVIDDYLSKDINLSDLESLSNSASTENIVMYEPISPAGSDYNII